MREKEKQNIKTYSIINFRAHTNTHKKKCCRTRIHKQQNATVTATTTLRLTKERVATTAEAEQQSKKNAHKKEEQK